MSKHTQHYLELNRRPEPSTWAIYPAAVFASIALWFVTTVLFSL